MAGEFDVVFNSGTSTEIRYTEDDDLVGLVEVTESDQTYFQKGVVQLVDALSSQSLGDSAIILMDDIIQFDGYVSNKQQTIAGGKINDVYSLVGRTYDLWRYSTPDTLSYSDQTTAYIANDLVTNYVTAVSGNDITVTEGVEISDIDLANKIVGDAIVELTKYDGYKFFVDTDGELQYYTQADKVYDFTITEDDIIDMTPIEDADEDVFNDILVVGGSGYSEKDEQTLMDSSQCFPSGIWVAQSFIAKSHTLSAVDLYLDRTTDPNQPTTLNFEVWGDTAPILFEDDFDDYNYLRTASNSGVSVVESRLVLECGDDTQNFGNHHGSGPEGEFGWGQKFVPPSGVLVSEIWFQTAPTYPSQLICRIFGEDGSALPDETNQIGSTVFLTSPTTPARFDFSDQDILLASGVAYYITFSSNDTYTESVVAYVKLDNDWNSFFPKAAYVDTKNGSWANWTEGSPDQNRIGMKVIGYAGFSKTGSIKTKSNSASCQYMKLILTGVVSSNNIGLSGSNDSGSTWTQLTDGEWVDFGSESNTGCIVQYHMSGDGQYTPRIGSAELQIADSTGAFDSLVLTENFDDWTNLSGNTKVRITVDDSEVHEGKLVLSGNNNLLGEPEWINPEDVTWTELHGVWAGPGDGDGYGRDPTSTITEDTNYYCCMQTPNPTNHANLIYALTGSSLEPIYPAIDKFRIRWWDPDPQSHEFLNKAIYVSGNWSDGWVDASRAAFYWDPQRSKEHLKIGDGPDEMFINDEEYIYSGVKKIMFSGAYLWEDFSQMRFYYIQFRAYPNYGSAGHIKTSTQTAAGATDMHFIRVEPGDTRYNDLITYSGSADSGNTWVKLTPGINTEVGNPGKEIVVMYVLTPSTNGWATPSSAKPITPYLESCEIYTSILHGGGMPKSGTHANGGKIEFSDEVTFTDGDIPYPPDWSGWQTYSTPKLSGLTIDSRYWLVMYHNSANSKWWKFYYDKDSAYGEKIMYSWYGDNFKEKWSSNSQLPSVVPAGDMAFKLGWTEGSITATSSNTESINAYGRHFKRIEDTSITTQSLANARASAEISSSKNPVKKGTITIDGRTNMSADYRFSSNFTNFGLNSVHDIVSYTQRIDDNGFVTIINYGKQPFDIAKKVSELEKEVGLK